MATSGIGVWQAIGKNKNAAENAFWSVLSERLLGAFVYFPMNGH